MKPILRPGLSAFIASAVFTSLTKDGDEVCSTRSSYCRAYGDDVGEAQPMRRRVDQLRIRNEGGGLRKPGRIPEGANLAPHLIARAGAAIEAVIGRSLQEERSHLRSVPQLDVNGSIGPKLESMTSPHHCPRQEARQEDSRSSIGREVG